MYMTHIMCHTPTEYAIPPNIRRENFYWILWSSWRFSPSKASCYTVHVHVVVQVHVCVYGEMHVHCILWCTWFSPTLAGVNCSVLYSLKALKTIHDHTWCTSLDVVKTVKPTLHFPPSTDDHCQAILWHLHKDKWINNPSFINDAAHIHNITCTCILYMYAI